MAEARGAAGVEADHDDGGEGGGYEGEAMAVVEAIANNTRAVLILNTANRSALPFLDERAVVEVPCVVGRTGPVPVAIGAVPAHARALMTAIKDVERTTIEAALTGSADLAVRALALHPLVPRVSTAREIFAGYRERLPELQERFAHERRRRRHRHRRSWTSRSSGSRRCPSPGEERFAGDLLRSPGGGAINAIGAARLGLRPRSRCRSARTSTGDFIRAALDDEGIALDRRRHAHAHHRGHAARRRARDGDLRARRARAPPRSRPSTRAP